MKKILGKLAISTLAAALGCACLTGCDDSSMIHFFDSAAAEQVPEQPQQK